MVRRLVYIVCAGLCVCAAAAVRGVERGIDWLLGVMRPEPFRFDIGGELVSAAPFSMFTDPQVERHEARVSRRAAARHI